MKRAVQVKVAQKNGQKGPNNGVLSASLFESQVVATAHSKIDSAVLSQLKKLRIEPAKICPDHVFIRRVYLDVIGTLPTAEQVKAFLSDKSKNKRRVLIDQLLERDEFAEYWAMKWCDLLRVKSEFPINLWPNAAQAYHRWIRTSIKQNKPYDQFVRELLTSSGSNFRVPQVNFYRAVQNSEPSTLAQSVAMTFMGTRVSKWKKEKFRNLTLFFSQVGFKKTQEWKEEIIYFDSVKAASDEISSTTKMAVFPDGKKVHLSSQKDPREVFADWLITSTNPWFTKNIVNRIWYWLFGQGIIHEPDDIRSDNPPSNATLLTQLQRELIASKYDLKHIYRRILNSQIYQLSCVAKSNNPKAKANFAFYPIRRLDAEVLIDALCQITGTTEQYSSLIPEPFTFIPEQCRSIALPDGSISSPFLEMFGRPPRDTGLASERNNQPTASQRLHLLNSSHVRLKIERSSIMRKQMSIARKNPNAAITWLYLTILSRYPLEHEITLVKGYTKSSKRGWRALHDLTWALINSSEFLYRH